MSAAGPPPPAPGPAAGLAAQVFGGLAWSFVGIAGQSVLRLVVLALLARLLTPAHFGVVGAALILVTLGTTLAQLGVGPAIVQRPALSARLVRAGFTLSVLLGAVMSVVAWLVAPGVAALVRIPEVGPVLRGLAIVFLLQGPSVVAESLLTRELRFRALALVDLVAHGAGYGAVGVALALLGFGPGALIGGLLAQSAVRTAMVLLLRPHPWRPLLARGPVGDLLNFGGGYTLARVANFVASQADHFVIGRWLGAEVLGLYGRAVQVMVAPAMFLGECLDRVLFPAMARMQSARERLGRAYLRGVGFVALVMLPASGVLVVLAPEIVAVLLGPAWEGVVLPLRILAAGLLFRTSYKLSDSLVRATGAVYRRAGRQALYAALVAGGAWLGHPAGLAGVAAGVAAAIAIHFLLMVRLSCTLAGLTAGAVWAAHRPAVAPALAATGLAWAVAALGRAAGLAPALVLALALTAVALPAVLLVRWAPRATLGVEGHSMLRDFGAWFLARLRRERPHPDPLLDPPLAGKEAGIP